MGTNQIPAKYLKTASVNQVGNKPNTFNTGGINQMKPNNTLQQQGTFGNAPKANNTLSNQLSKGNTFNSNANDGIRDQNSYGSRMSNGMNSTASNSYQRSATFGNQNSNAGNFNNARNSTNNKVNSIVSPHKKLSELSLDDFTPISALVGFTTGFTIKAKIIKKTNIRSYQKNGSEGQVFSIEIVDNDGGEIQGSFFGDAAKDFYPKLEEGHVYVFSGGTVKVANTKFQT